MYGEEAVASEQDLKPETEYLEKVSLYFNQTGTCARQMKHQCHGIFSWQCQTAFMSNLSFLCVEMRAVFEMKGCVFIEYQLHFQYCYSL